MREIKFRGKRTDNGEWVYGFYNFTIFDDGSDELMAVIKQHIIADENGYVWSIDKNTVGQFTGLKDIDETKIFEGDVIECGDGKVPTLIEWHDESHSFLAYNLKRKEFHRLDKYFIRYIGEVIGNIHDNPELLVEDYD